MSEGKLSVAVELDTSSVVDDGLVDGILDKIRPALARVRQEVDKALNSGGGGGGGRGPTLNIGADVSKSLASELARAGDEGSKALAKSLAAGLPAAEARVQAAAKNYASALTNSVGPGGRQAAEKWGVEFQNALRARDALAPFAASLGKGGGTFGNLGSSIAGTFIGTFASNLATKGLDAVMGFAASAMQGVQSVLSGGWDRLVSIDTAKTKLEALGNSAGDVKLIMANALEAVKGTAFGMGDAANVAATAVAAQVKPGQAMVDYLRLIADTAAVARRQGESFGSAFSEIGVIMNRITQQGYSQSEFIQELSYRNLPIWQNLAKVLNTDIPGAMEQAASDSGIAASKIREALQMTVGGAALKMGESFEGGVTNAKAALDRLGEALLKPLFEPTKDGVSQATKAIDDLTRSVVQNGPQITEVFGAIAIAIVDVTAFVARGVGDLIAGVGEIIAPLGDIQGAMLQFQAWQADIRGDDEVAADLREQADAAYGLGDRWKELGEKLENINPDPLKARINDLTKSIADGQKVNLEYAKSQEALSAAVEAGLGPVVYQAQIMEWIGKVRAMATGGPPAGPAPVYPGAGKTQTPGTGMPADVVRGGSGGGSTSKEKAPPLFGPGGKIPTLDEWMAGGGAAGAAGATLPDAAADLSQTATTDLPKAASDLSDAAGALTQAAQSGIGGVGMFSGQLGLNPANVPTTGLQPQAMAALAAIQGQFPGIAPLTSGFRASDPFEWHPGGRGLDLGFPETPEGKAMGDQVNAWILANKELLGVYGTLWQVADHYNHIHVSIKDELSPLLAMGGGMPGMTGLDVLMGAGGSMPPLPSMPGLGGATGYQVPGAWKAPDPDKIREQNQKIADLEDSLRIKELQIGEMRADATQSQVASALKERDKLIREIGDAKKDLKEIQRGSYEKGTAAKSAQQFDFNQLPYGHPMRVAAGALGGMGVTPQDVGAILGSAAGPLGSVAGQTAGAIFGMPLPGPMGYAGTPTAPATDLNQLIKEGNPLALFQAAGIDVPDYSRAGGGPGAQDLMVQGGPASDAMGRMYSDTAALIDRTFTNLDAAEKARHDQVMTVLNEVRSRLAKDYVEPVTTAAVTGGIQGMGTGTATAIGTAMGQAAAGPIASAVSDGGGGGAGGQLVNTAAMSVANAGAAVQGMASGGAVVGPGTSTSDSILARLSHGEWVLNARQVSALGGFRGVQAMVNSLPRFATGGGVDVSSTVGAEFFGVGQVPILAAIVNLLVAVLLKVIGVTIEERDTLNEISADFRDFRGEFRAFDASGRMMNDTSGLVDRTGSSEQAAADERIRILKMVLEGLFKFIVEKIVVPVAKAVGNSLLQAASGAASGALGAAFPGGSVVGGMIGNVITSAGGAGIEIAGEVGTIVAESIFSVAQDAIGELLQSLLPGITNGVFGGGLLSMIVDPITGVLNGLFSGVATLFGGLFGGLSTLIPGLPFDNGGVAVGTGLMPKATIQPERVLSPRQTESFDRLVDVLSSGRLQNMTTIHAPFTVTGGERGAREARDRLLALMS